MGIRSGIEWTDSTWTPIRARVKQNAPEIARAKGYTSLIQIAAKMVRHVGPACVGVSPACKLCYSGVNNGRCLPNNGTGLPFDARSLDLVDIFVDEKILVQPLKWKTPRRVFVCSQTDLFGEFVPLEYIKRSFEIMVKAHWHTFLVLTKRSKRLLALAPFLPWPPNVWIGVSVESPEYFFRIDDLRQVPATVRFLSLEPLLEPLPGLDLTGIHWVIVGGESGAGARPMEPAWPEEIRLICEKAKVPFFFKQRGGFPKKKFGRTLNGRTYDEYPPLLPGETALDVVDAAIVEVGQDDEESESSGGLVQIQAAPPRLEVPEPESPGIGNTPNEAGIVEQIEEFITDYAAFRRAYYALPIALWALATHCHMQFRAFGFLVFTDAEYGSAKTYMLELLEKLVCQGRLQSKITLSAMCSEIEQDHPTLLIDQAEGLATTEESALMRSILSGYKQGATVTVRRGAGVVRRSVYGPKAFALVGDLMLAAMDRAIVVRMERLTPNKLRDENENDWEERGDKIKMQASALVEKRKEDINDAIANFRRPDFLTGREIEIWKPLLVMCDLFCPKRRAELEQTAADICAAKRAEPKKVSPAEAKKKADLRIDGERLVRDLLMLCGDARGIRTRDALERLKQIPTAPWRNYADEGLNEIKMAEIAASKGIMPKQFKAAGTNRRGYLKADLERAVDSSPLTHSGVAR